MISHPLIDEYIELWQNGKIILNKERIMLIEYLQKYILTRDDVYFDNDLIKKYVRFAEKNFFPLAKYQKFITPFMFLFQKSDGEPFFDEFFITLARGGGKNGFMSTRDMFFISPLYPVRGYNVTITANSEDQAKVSFKEVYDVAITKSLENHFYLTKTLILGKANTSEFKYRTNNPKTMDSARDGCLEFDEIHGFENQDAVDIQMSGLGKIAHSRTFYNGTNGYVRDGFYDKLTERSMNLLRGESKDDIHLFPFICKLDHPDEVEDPSNWSKANPMFDEDTPYAKRLFNKVMKAWKSLDAEPSRRKEFMTKRMNMTTADAEKDVTSRQKLLATQRNIPYDFRGSSCVVGMDFASIKDFASAGMLFKYGDEYVWKQHSFARKQAIKEFAMKPPFDEWEEKGIITLVDGPSIDPHLIVDKINEWRNQGYVIDIVVGDSFRMDLIKPLLEENGYEYEFLRNPGGVQSKVAPIIEDGFENERFIFGDDPSMLWYVDNTYTKQDGNGNIRYLKKEPVRRKTDGFHAFIAALYKREILVEDSMADLLGMVNSLEF